MAAVFRLVMCPKCRQVLPEVPNVPLYRCGGCGALLQAKNQKVEAKRRESKQQETNIEVMKDSRHEAKASPDNVEDHQDGYGDCKGEEPGAEGPRVESDEQTKLLRAIHELQHKLDRIGDIPTCYNHHCCHCHPQEVKLSNTSHIIPCSSPNRSSNHAYRHSCRDMSHASYSMEKIRDFSVEAARPPIADKCSSEVQVKKHQKSRSPLHRLMGYSSPSLIIRGT